MPRVAKELSALEVKRLVHPGGRRSPVVHSVGGVPGLMLQVTPGDGKSWLLRTVVAGKRREIGLGGFPAVTLAMARQRAREVRDEIWRGGDPVLERLAKRAEVVKAAARAITFAEATERYLAAKLTEFSNPKHKQQWQNTLATYAFPHIGGMQVSDVDVTDIQRCLQPIWHSKTETAQRLRGRIEGVLAWSRVSGHRTGDNPARWKGNLDAILPKPAAVARAGNQPALTLADAPRWFADLRQRDGTAARALEFACLTAARSGEVRGAEWPEIDLQAGVWTIPASRMKAGAEHRAALSPAAVVLLAAIPRASDLVFPAPRGGLLSDMSLSAVMRRMQDAEAKAGRRGWLDSKSGRPAVPHGLRSTFRNWAAERTTYPREMAEFALAHKIESAVERAYLRTDMLRDWSAFLEAQPKC